MTDLVDNEKAGTRTGEWRGHVVKSKGRGRWNGQRSTRAASRALQSMQWGRSGVGGRIGWASFKSAYHQSFSLLSHLPLLQNRCPWPANCTHNVNANAMVSLSYSKWFFSHTLRFFSNHQVKRVIALHSGKLLGSIWLYVTTPAGKLVNISSNQSLVPYCEVNAHAERVSFCTLSPFSSISLVWN